MAKFLCNRSIQAFGQVYTENTVITLSEDETATEAAKGFNPKTNKHLSPIFNHCSPIDKEAEEAFAQVFEGKEKPKEAEKPEGSDEKVEIARIREELEAIEISYDRRWGVSRLQEELIKSKKKRGL